MTMADFIVVMHDGRIEQFGGPADLYERPASAFVANFLGVSNLLPGTVEGTDAVRLDSGTVLRVPTGTLNGPSQTTLVHVNGQLMNAEAWKHQIIAWRNGAPVRFADIGTAVDIRPPGGRVSPGSASRAPSR